MSLTHDLLARRASAVSTGAATTHPIFVARAEGAEIEDVEGKRYIDFASGVAVMSVGHGHPHVAAAISTQLQAYAHIGFMIAAYEPYVAVCEALNRRAPIKDARSALFTTGGEAVEAAIKVARIHTGRTGVVAFSGAWHGRTQLTAALTGKTGPLRQGNPPQQGVFHIPFPNADCPVGQTISSLEQLFRASVSPEQVAAIIVEPVQGEGGFFQAPALLIEYLRDTCDRFDICLIADEIQSGFGRTGRFFAFEHYSVTPDLIVTGKALGGGLPLSALIGPAHLMNKPSPGALGGTYAGNPVACAAALAVMETIDREKLLARAEEIGTMMRQRLGAMQRTLGSHPIGAIRQIGAMVAFDLIDRDGRYDPLRTKAIADNARAEGVIVLPCGYHGATIRLSSPLNISVRLLNEGLERLERAVSRGLAVEEHANA